MPKLSAILRKIYFYCSYCMSIISYILPFGSFVIISGFRSPEAYFALNSASNGLLVNLFCDILARTEAVEDEHIQ